MKLTHVSLNCRLCLAFADPTELVKSCATHLEEFISEGLRNLSKNVVGDDIDAGPSELGLPRTDVITCAMAV